MAATQILHADHLAGGRLDHIRTGDEHVGVLASHDDQIGQRRAVHGTTGARTENQRKLWYESACLAGLREQVTVLRERGHALLDARAAGIDQCDDRHLEIQCLIHQPADLTTFGHAQCAALDGEVLRIDGHFAAVDLAEAGDDGGTRLTSVDVAAAESADFLESAGIEQQIEPFAGGQLAFDMLTVAGMVLRLVRKLRGTQHRGTDRLRAFDMIHGILHGRAGENIGHCSASSSLDSGVVPATLMVSSVSPASTPLAGPTKIFVTVPLTGAYT